MKKIYFVIVLILFASSIANAQIVGATDNTQPTSTEGEVYVPSSVSLGFDVYFAYSWGRWYMRDGSIHEEYKYWRLPFSFSVNLDYFGANSVRVSSGNIYSSTSGVGLGLAYVNRGGTLTTNDARLNLSCLSVRLSAVDRSGKNNSGRMRFGIGADLPMKASLWVDSYGSNEADITSWMSGVSPSLFYEFHLSSGLLHIGLYEEMYLTLFKKEMLPIESSYMFGFCTGIYIGWESKSMHTSK